MFDYNLLMKYQQSKDISLRNKLIEQAIPLVHHVAHKVYKNLGNGHEYEDLAAYGIFGLIQAIDRFDLTKNTKFSTYAIPRIHGAIIDELRKIDWVPRSVRKKIKAAQEDMVLSYQIFGNDVSEYEIARKHGLNMREYNILINDFMYNISECYQQYC